ncbi:MAG: MBL fold metallo-hydrolase [Rhodospirillaceae bacterium]|jgi:phosphoribosyl 1,2-cyclic phosphate phosphodiesterase|nr:MBL fold metallo-hydrolase [Rhodospirillaceae bacterium]MBT4489175.1 MBL fold metallo-hydrolase [Rhodospirillaceae bacterium]MBT5193835.1 MBL fold metallo-hydrolase [Rhodospirillaceae bacterium]MBT5898331.1 MBL fold metallo-hydrolase [Rhodospirillaceae bacterium]MBT6427468.1 MBL fold metallo-hydrolase [Rhodospirillaceae bacterium]
MRVTVLGCGTSGGVPRIGNVWGVCDQEEPRNRRRRSSILVQSATTNLIVDTTPDLREQCLDADLNRLDAALYTHDHADHVNGIDDLRGFMVLQRNRIPIYGDAGTIDSLRQRFGYIFASARDYPPIATAHAIDGPFSVGDIDILPFQQIHGGMDSLGFRFGDIAYSTDLSDLPEASFEMLRGLDVWIVDALRPKPHPTHTHLARTLEWIERLRPKRAILTHMTWDMDYATLCRDLPPGVEPAYDGQIIELPG